MDYYKIITMNGRSAWAGRSPHESAFSLYYEEGKETYAKENTIGILVFAGKESVARFFYNGMIEVGFHKVHQATPIGDIWKNPPGFFIGDLEKSYEVLWEKMKEGKPLKEVMETIYKQKLIVLFGSLQLATHLPEGTVACEGILLGEEVPLTRFGIPVEWQK